METLTLKEPTLITQLEVLAQEQTVSAEHLLNEAVNQYLKIAHRRSTDEERQEPTVPAEFLEEMAAFERLKPQLLKTYRGKVVAVHGGEVVAVGDNRMDVYGEVLEKFGQVPCYVEWVEENTPRTARITSTWIAR